MKKLFAILLALCLLLSLCGCGGESADDKYAGYESPSFSESADDELNFSVSETVGSQSSVSGTADKSTAADLSEKLIYRADMTIATAHFDSAISALDSLAFEMGGFIESSQVSGSASWNSDGSSSLEDRRATYVLRVPCDRFREAMGRTGELGVVQDSSTSVENISQQFIDRTARKHSLEVQEQRLLEMLQQAEDVYILVELEDRLAEVRYEIESIESTLRSWQQQVDYSTIQVYLREVKVSSPEVTGKPSFGQELGEAIGDGWSGFVGLLRGLALFLAHIMPLIVIVAVIAAVCIIAAVVSRRKRQRQFAAMGRSAKPDKVPESTQASESADK